jgi:hypothetical protein
VRIATTIAVTLLRLTAVILLTLGLLFWSGNALNLIPVHMLTGLVLVLALWALAVLGLRAGVPPALGGLALVWGLIVPVLGVTQDSLVPGDAHVLVKVLHLLVGVIAIGLGESLARRILAGERVPGRERAASATSP